MDASVIIACHNEPTHFDVGEAVGNIRNVAVDFIAKAQIDRHVPRRPPVILCMKMEPCGAAVFFSSTDAGLGSRWIPQEEIGKGIAVGQTGSRRRESRSKGKR